MLILIGQTFKSSFLPKTDDKSMFKSSHLEYERNPSPYLNETDTSPIYFSEPIGVDQLAKNRENGESQADISTFNHPPTSVLQVSCGFIVNMYSNENYWSSRYFFNNR